MDRFWPQLAMGLALLASPCLADTVSYYEYPFVDPLEATVLATPSIYAAELPDDVPVEERQLLVFPKRAIPEIFWYTARFHYSLAAQPHEAPLAFVIPGTGANFDSPKTVILMTILYQAGLHVVSLASSIHPNFIVSASTSRRPGLLRRDAEDTYRVMELIRRQIQDEIEISNYHLAGYSLGGAQAAFVARLDEERRAFDFDKVLLINPPVNLYQSARILDRMFDNNIRSLSDFNRLFNQMMSALSGVYQQTEAVSFNEDFLYEIYKRNPPKESTLEALIGTAFRFTSMNLSFVSDVMTNSGYIVPKDTVLTTSTSLTPYFKATSQLAFEDYARQMIIPYDETPHETTFEEMMEATSLRAIQDYLRGATKISLMHNEDDPILGEGDVTYLEQLFGERAHIYPKGGHCGNMLYKDNVAYVIDFFSR